ncbi:hypothetical protein BO71DRAFT_144295 [Aspergillus ellipticus CBS 707.79]|uniref:Zn(2)-C6 fungal-type domain-containing protein n=1 Tax=Aspergillus ellipticus CBS 707.79 TaxID=1448320 RepID=A0A319DJH9_9EURO|nr:hypothetical protein BO71DRAFT_144295 [Aspergillus ellipticus CBS 707.79]
MFHHVQMPPPPSQDTSADDASAKPKERTRRACERCRQMKIKCNGATPCGHCRTSFNDCAYPEPRRKRKPSPHSDRLHELEKRIKAMEESQHTTLLAKERPCTASPSSSTSQQQEPTVAVGSALNGNFHHAEPERIGSMLQDRSAHGEARSGVSGSDRAFIERLKAELGAWDTADFDSRLLLRERPSLQLFQPRTTSLQKVVLPPRARAEYLINLALDASELYHVLHRPAFDVSFELLYTLNRGDYSEGEIRHMPLVYALMSLGCLFQKTEYGSLESGDELATESATYFTIARDLVDLQNCNDTVTLQAIFYMNLVILSTERLSPSYSCLSHAFSLSIRLNLQQRSVKDIPIITEVKRRLFWALRQLLTFVATGCGLARPIDGREIDIPHPLDIDDSDHKMEKIGSSPEDPVAVRTMSCTVALFKLYCVFDHIVQQMYPSPSASRAKDGSGSAKRLVSKETVISLEKELQKWAESLPLACRLGHSRHAPHLEKAKYELCMSYAHAQILLYRPFIHHLLDDSVGNSDVFQKFASGCVDASRSLIHLAEDMHRDGLLFGAHWRIAYMIGTATLSLIYVVVGSKDRNNTQHLKADLKTAKKMLSCLWPYSSHSRRLHVVLTVLTAAIFKSDHGSQSQTPSTAPSTAPSKQDESVTSALAEKAFGIQSQSKGDYVSPVVVQTIAHSSSLMQHPGEMHALQSNPPGVFSMIPATQPRMTHLNSALTPSGYGVQLQPNNPSANMSATVSEDINPQSSEQVVEPISGAAHTYGLDAVIAESSNYLEGRSFNLPRDMACEDFLFQRELGDFGMSGELLSLDYFF